MVHLPFLDASCAADDERLDTLLQSLDCNAAEGALAATGQHTLRGKSRQRFADEAVRQHAGVSKGIAALGTRLRDAVQVWHFLRHCLAHWLSMSSGFIIVLQTLIFMRQALYMTHVQQLHHARTLTNSCNVLAGWNILKYGCAAGRGIGR